MILSRTVISGVLVLIVGVLQLFGIQWDFADREGLINSIVIIGGAALSIYFRFIAKTNLQTGAPLKPTPKAEEPTPPTIVIKD